MGHFGQIGRTDMAVVLRYSGFKMVLIIEVKVKEIKKGDDKSVNKTHDANMKSAMKQVQNNFWEKSKTSSIQRVIVSGVWHPAPCLTETDITPYQLSSRYEFVREEPL